MRQLSLFPATAQHGGLLHQQKRKTRRPLSVKRPLHLVLKARGNLFVHRSSIGSLLDRQAEKFQVRIYDQAVAFDHIHLLLKIPGRREYAAFLRAFCGILARKLGTGIWKLLPYSRLASWGREFRALKRYLLQNREEAEGKRPLRLQRRWERIG